MLGSPSLPLFVFVRVSMTPPPPLLNERTFWMTPNVKVMNVHIITFTILKFWRHYKALYFSSVKPIFFNGMFALEKNVMW